MQADKLPDCFLRRCDAHDFEAIGTIINDGAQAYKGVIPADCWQEPYMQMEKLHHEIDSGVSFWCCEEDGVVLGVMGYQQVLDVTLIRHAYVSSNSQARGIGGRLLSRLLELTDKPVLVGTWRDAAWAIRFYEKHGFKVVVPSEKDRLLKKYWNIPERQIETSLVLADARWRAKSAES